MVGMFEGAIRSANASGDYDRARACAVQKLEQAKSLPYETVETGLPGGVCEPSGFGYTIVTQSIDTDLGDGSGVVGTLTVFPGSCPDGEPEEETLVERDSGLHPRGGTGLLDDALRRAFRPICDLRRERQDLRLRP